jgi:NADH-quinone oxidoreductase subunit L
LRKLRVFEPPMWIGPVLYGVAVCAAAMTAFYMCRLYILTFWGDFRGWTVGRPSLLALEERKDDGHDDEHHENLATPGYPPHESPWQMTVPLIILAAFALLAGVLNPGFHMLKEPPMEHWLKPVFSGTESAVKLRPNAEHLEWSLALGGILAFASGTLLAWWMYIKEKGEPARRAAAAVPGLYRLLLDKWRVDELYDVTVISAVDSLAETSAAFDKTFVDGILATVTSTIVAALGTVLRAFQNGVVHVYAATMVVGLAFVGWFFAMPHANATINDAGNDDYVITAAPGVGYAYRWDADGDGKPDKADFGNDSTVKLHVTPGKSQKVGLEVKNAFGLVGTKSINVARPSEPTASL